MVERLELEKLKPDKIARIYDGFRNGQSLAADFESRFKAKLDEEDGGKN